MGVGQPMLIGIMFGESLKAADERWITVHPNGKDQPGTPVLLKVDPNNPNRGRVIGGAGGKLNYSVFHMKTDAQYRSEAAQRRRERREAAQARRGTDAPGPKKTAAKEEIKAAREQAETAVIKEAAAALGWDESALQPSADDLAGLDEQAADKVRRQHRAGLLRDIRRAARQGRDLLLRDATARAEAGLGEITLAGDNKLGAEDLIGEREMRRHLGYQAESSTLSKDEIRAERVRAIEARIDDERDVDPESAARTASRLARYRAIDNDDISGAHPTAMAGFARQASRRLERMEAYYDALNAAEEESGREPTPFPIPQEDVDELNVLYDMAMKGSTMVAVANATSNPRKFREWLELASKHGLLDPARAKDIDQRAQDLRFERLNAPSPDAIDEAAVNQLQGEGLTALVNEAIARVRSDSGAPVDIRRQARSLVDGNVVSGETDGRQTNVIDAINNARAADLAEEGLVASELQDDQKRAFLQAAIRAGIVGKAGDREMSPAEAKDEKSEDRATVIDDGATAARLHKLATDLKKIDRTARAKNRAIEKGEEVPESKTGELAGAGSQYDPSKDVSDRDVGKGGWIDLAYSKADHDRLVADLQEEARQATARSFLEQLSSTYEDMTSAASLDGDEARADLHRHLSHGAADALNNHSLEIVGSPLLDRQAIDTLGAAGAAQLLAWHIHQEHSDPEAVAEALGEYHAGTQVETATEAMNSARESYESAHEIHQGMLDHSGPADLRHWHTLNQQRLKHLYAARQTLGQTLGAMEATAALHLAATRAPAEEIKASMGRLDVATATKQVNALGLEPADYQIDHDGTNAFLTIRKTGFSKLLRPVDRDVVQQHADMQAIKRGDHDEEGWIPAGFAKRTDAHDYTGPGAKLHAQPFDYKLDQHPTVHHAMRAFIAERVHDGWSAEEIHRELLSQDHQAALRDAHGQGGLFGGGMSPEEAQQQYRTALDDLLPHRHDEGNTRAQMERHERRVRDLAEQHLIDRGGDLEGALHHQELHSEHARDATFRALSRHPAAVAAFKPVGQLTHVERSALREAYYREFGRREDDPRPGSAALADWRQKNPEPPAEIDGLFGAEKNPAWAEWKAEHDAFAAGQRVDPHEDGEDPPDWPLYVAAHRGSAAAYAAMQDVVKSKFLADFTRQYQGLAQQPLKVGHTPIAGWERHALAFDPSVKKAWKEHVESGKKRDTSGRYTYSAALEAAEASAGEARAAKQHQTEIGGEGYAERAARRAAKAAPEHHERWTLGETAENHVADLVGEFGGMIDPSRPFTARTGISMSGRFVHQQRAVKAWLRSKRIGLFQGAGGGKTNISFGAFGEARKAGHVERGIFAVPSIVQKQFGTEALSYLEPGKTRWFAGGAEAERMQAYRDPETHMVVITHQGIRDDVTKMVARHMTESEGVSTSPEEVATRMTGYGPDGQHRPDLEWSQEELDAKVRDALTAHGAEKLLGFFAVDEGHTALNRQGKRDSHLARVIDSIGRNATYAGYMTGSPIKNDRSEEYDQLAKIAPHRYGDGAGKVGRAEYMRRYDVNTSAAEAGRRRELSAWTFINPTDAGTRPNYHNEVLQPSKPQQARLEEVESAYSAARRAQMRGEVDAGAVRTLAPRAFDGVADDGHLEVAKRVGSALGIARETAYNHAINSDPESRKLDRAVELANQYRSAGRHAGVIFARNLSTVDAYKRRLEAEGHKVVTITGRDSSEAKDAAKSTYAGGDHIAIMSDAGATGANMQNGSWLIQHDVPMTYMTWDQRQARVNRIGQKRENPDIHTLSIDHPWEHANIERLERKRALHESVFEGANEMLDDTGLAHWIRKSIEERARRKVAA